MEISISKHDLLNCYRLYSTPEIKHLLILGVITAGLVIFVAMKIDNPTLIIAFGLLGGILGISVQRYIYLNYKSNKIYSQQKELHRPIKMEFSDEGITTITKNGSNLSPWSNFCRYKSNKNYILLFYSDALFLMLPKNQIPPTEMHFLNKRLESIGS